MQVWISPYLAFSQTHEWPRRYQTNKKIGAFCQIPMKINQRVPGSLLFQPRRSSVPYGTLSRAWTWSYIRKPLMVVKFSNCNWILCGFMVIWGLLHKNRTEFSGHDANSALLLDQTLAAYTCHTWWHSLRETPSVSFSGSFRAFSFVVSSYLLACYKPLWLEDWASSPIHPLQISLIFVYYYFITSRISILTV